MDIALAVDKIVPAAEYFGSVTANTEAAWKAVDWRDSRPRPTWGELEKTWKQAAAETAWQQRLKEIDAKLDQLDAEYLTPRVLANLPFGDAYSLARREEHNRAAAPLRQERAAHLNNDSEVQNAEN